MSNYDVLFMHNHFVLVTTVILDEESDEETIEQAALKRLADEYGDEFAAVIKSSREVTIEELEPVLESSDGINFVPQRPMPGDPEDAGMER